MPSLSMRLIQRLSCVYRGLPKVASGSIITLAVNSRMYGAAYKKGGRKLLFWGLLSVSFLIQLPR